MAHCCCWNHFSGDTVTLGSSPTPDLLRSQSQPVPLLTQICIKLMVQTTMLTTTTHLTKSPVVGLSTMLHGAWLETTKGEGRMYGGILMGVVLLSRWQIGQTGGTEQQIILMFLSQCWKHLRSGQVGREWDEDCIVLRSVLLLPITCVHQETLLDLVKEETCSTWCVNGLKKEEEQCLQAEHRFNQKL